MDFKAFAAEVFGTFLLIFIGAGAVAVGVGGLIGAAFAHGFVVIAYPYGYGSLSGSYLNPAVSFGLFAAGEMKPGKMAAYWAAQAAGGIAGGALLFFLLGAESSLGATVLAEGISPGKGLLLEAVLTFILVNAVLAVPASGRAGNLAPIIVGFTLIFCILMGGPLTGASLNPARTLGPALFTDTLNLFWIYFTGTFAGAAAAGLIHRVWRSRSPAGPGSGKDEDA